LERGLDGADSSDFKLTAARAVEGVQVATRLLSLDPEQTHFSVAFRTKQERLDWIERLGHAGHHAPGIAE
jgi:hypothetical protein